MILLLKSFLQNMSRSRSRIFRERTNKPNNFICMTCNESASIQTNMGHLCESCHLNMTSRAKKHTKDELKALRRKMNKTLRPQEPVEKDDEDTVVDIV